MFVNRDFFDTIRQKSKLEAVLLWGPRQVGKTTLLDQLPLNSRVFLDDLSLRTKAQNDPAFFLEDLKFPCLIDEVQYAPNLFPQMKFIIDQNRRDNIQSKKNTNTLFYLTGSNKTLLDKNIKESLAGRCHLFHLHGFSVREIVNHSLESQIKKIILKGGFPELYIRENLSPKMYFNDYINSFIEKDIAYSSGIDKIEEFHTVLKLLSARTGHFLNISDISKIAGVDQKTIKSWINILKKNAVVDLVPTYATNLSKRVVKMKKFFFYDTGLCARLQGHENEELLWNSVQIGALFETLAFSEIVKTKDNFLKDWEIFTWRTKEKNEIDFIIKSKNKFLFAEVKLGIHSAQPFLLDSEVQKIISHENHQKIVITSSGKIENISRDTQKVPIQKIGDFLLEWDEE